MLSKAHSMEQLKNALLQKIQEHGFALASSEKTADRGGMVHTIGLWATAGHPELVIFGEDLNGAEKRLDELARRVIQGEWICFDAKAPERAFDGQWSQSDVFSRPLSPDQAEMPQAMCSWTLGSCAAASSWMEIQTQDRLASVSEHPLSQPKTCPEMPSPGLSPTPESPLQREGEPVSAHPAEPHLNEERPDAGSPSRALEWLAKEAPKTVCGNSEKDNLGLIFGHPQPSVSSADSIAKGRGFFAALSRGAAASLNFDANDAFRAKNSEKDREHQKKNPRMTFWTAARGVVESLGDILAQGAEQASERPATGGAWAWRPNKDSVSSPFLPSFASTGLAPSARDDLLNFFRRESAPFAPQDPQEQAMFDLGAGLEPSAPSGNERLAAWNNLFEPSDEARENDPNSAQIERSLNDEPERSQTRASRATIRDWDALGPPESPKGWGRHGSGDQPRASTHSRGEPVRRVKKNLPKAH